MFIPNPSFGLAYKLTVFFGQSDTLNKLKTATLSVKEKILHELSIAIEAFSFHYLQHGSSNTFFSVMVVGVNHQQNVWFGKVMLLAYKFVSLGNGMTSALYKAFIEFLD